MMHGKSDCLLSIQFKLILIVNHSFLSLWEFQKRILSVHSLLIWRFEQLKTKQNFNLLI